MDSSIFRAYDIRGIYPEQINQKVAKLIAESFCYFLKEKYKVAQPKILVSHDARLSSPVLARAVKNGLRRQGAYILDAGFATTPLNYFGNWYFKVDGSIVITASHDPKEYNGLKLFLRNVRPLATSTKKGTLILRDIIEKQDLGLQKARKEGNIKKISLFKDYQQFIVKHLKKQDFSLVNIAVDFGNGCVGPFFKRLAKKIDLSYQGFFEQPDGNFPNHEPNPLKIKALTDLRKALKTKKFNLGVAFDGDGDRTVFFDEKGNYIRADFILAILALYYLKKLKKMPAKNIRVVCDARASRGVIEALKKEKIKVIKSRVGYPFIKALMQKNKAAIGGELSGHIFWEDAHSSESGLLTFLRVIEVLIEEKKSISELVKPMQRYHDSGEINFEVKNREKIIQGLQNRYRDGKISKLDGLTIEYKDWWFNIRPSNTEPLLRLIVEANSKEMLQKKIKELRKLIMN